MTRALTIGFVVAVFLVATRLAAVACAAASARLPRRWSRSTSVRAGLAMAPVVLGAAIALSILAPELSRHGCHCATHGHHAHVCFEHPAFSWVLVLSAGAAAGLGALALASFGGLLDGLRRIVGFGRTFGGVGSELDGVRFHVVDGIGAQALTLGFVRPRIVVGRDLWDGLDADARRAIVHHEQAHVLRRDPATLFLVQLAACLMPRAAGRRLVDAWRLRAEIACDDHAARRLGDGTVVASALVACGRLQNPVGVKPGLPAMAATSGDDLEARVKSLLEPAGAAHAPPRNDLAVSLGVLAVCLGAITTGLGDEAHHAIETALGWIS